MKIAIVSPCFNEEQAIPLFCEEITRALADTDVDYSLVLVDDGSSDATLEQLIRLSRSDHRILPYSLSRNFGHQVALTAGLDVADADAVIMMDSDLQHPPHLIREMVRLWQEGNDVVSAVRRRTEGAGLFKRISSEGFYWIINHLSETQIVPGAADFCLLSRRAHAALKQMPERHRFLRGMVSWMGFRRAYIEYDAAKRVAGTSKYSLTKMLRLAMDAVMSFSSTPMRVATRVGGAVALLGFAYLAYVLFGWIFIPGFVKGWSSLISVVLILGGMQLLFIGIVGSYIGRIFEEVKHRPQYFFKYPPPEDGK